MRTKKNLFLTQKRYRLPTNEIPFCDIANNNININTKNSLQFVGYHRSMLLINKKRWKEQLKMKNKRRHDKLFNKPVSVVLPIVYIRHENKPLKLVI